MSYRIYLDKLDKRNDVNSSFRSALQVNTTRRLQMQQLYSTKPDRMELRQLLFY